MTLFGEFSGPPIGGEWGVSARLEANLSHCPPSGCDGHHVLMLSWKASLGSVTGITAFPALLSIEFSLEREDVNMAKKLTLVFLMVVVAALVAINSPAALPKHESAVLIVAK